MAIVPTTIIFENHMTMKVRDVFEMRKEGAGKKRHTGGDSMMNETDSIYN